MQLHSSKLGLTAGKCTLFFGRGGINGLPQPDVVERPGFRLDLVGRQGIKIAGQQADLKVELRNLTRTKYNEFQQSGNNRIIYNQYDPGMSASIGLSFNF